MLKLTTEQFIQKAISIHGNKYDYSKVKYVNTETKICIICPEHGEFWQTPHQHVGMHKQGCPKCGLEKSLRLAGEGKNKERNEEARNRFIEKAKEMHGNRYDYSKVEYKNNYTPVCIICPKHGEFWQKPYWHAQRGYDCPKCMNHNQQNNKELARIKSREFFIEHAKQIYGDHYDYSQMDYVDTNTKVKIICPKHGEFWQKPKNHLRGHGCFKCSGLYKTRKNIKELFPERASIIHNNKYDYSKVEYTKANENVCIICPIHGEFWQRPDNHLKGTGCPKCSESRGEREIAKWLDDHGVKYEREKEFDELRGVGGGNLRFDFYLPNDNTCIEFDGEQHKKWVKELMSEQQFFNLQENDKIKNGFCVKNGIKLFRISSKDMKKFEVIKVC